MDRQPDRQKDMQTDRLRDRQTNSQTDIQTARQTKRSTDANRLNGQTDQQTIRKIDKLQANRQKKHRYLQTNLDCKLLTVSSQKINCHSMQYIIN